MKQLLSILFVAMAALLIAACGGKQTVASKSAEAFRQSPQKPGEGGSHGGHTATATGSGAMAGMDHSTMTGMETSGGQTMSEMDHSKMAASGQSMAGMDHSKMNKSDQSMAGMDHSKMNKSDQSMAGMDHSKMNMGGQSMAGMNHGSLAEVPPAVPTTSLEMQSVKPSATLRTDDFDAPVAISVREAAKGPGEDEGGHAGMSMAPSTSENASTPAPSVDHSQHQMTTPATSNPKARTQSTVRRPAPPAKAKAAPIVKPPTPSKPQPAAVAASYSCPMHPEVTSGKPGSCPKCGMALVKKK